MVFRRKPHTSLELVVVERVNPCIRPLNATGLIVSVPTNCVLASSPENVLFVLGVGGMGEQPSLGRVFHSDSASTSPLDVSRDTNPRVCLSQSPQIGGRGLCSHRPLGVYMLSRYRHIAIYIQGSFYEYLDILQKYGRNIRLLT